MRKINEKDFVDFTFTDNGFKVTMRDFKYMVSLFESREHGTLIGNKPNGDIAIIDQK